jgi:hypothetical protein
MEYAEYLRGQELPGMGMGAPLIEEFLNALSQSDVKGFRQFFPVCFYATILYRLPTNLSHSHSSND